MPAPPDASLSEANSTLDKLEGLLAEQRQPTASDAVSACSAASHVRPARSCAGSGALRGTSAPAWHNSREPEHGAEGAQLPARVGSGGCTAVHELLVRERQELVGVLRELLCSGTDSTLSRQASGSCGFGWTVQPDLIEGSGETDDPVSASCTA